jgi:hypothetical protein
MRLRRLTAVVATLAAVAVAGCGSAVPSPSPSRAAGAVTPSTGSAGGAMAGFLAAARARDSRGVSQWLATSIDSTDLADLTTVYGGFGNGESLFWEVSGLRVTAVTVVDATHADVTLNGPVVWCGGAARADPSATCSEVTSVSGLRNTYIALRVGGTWKADIDVDASSSLSGNPGVPKTPAAPSASPT